MCKGYGSDEILVTKREKLLRYLTHHEREKEETNSLYRRANESKTKTRMNRTQINVKRISKEEKRQNRTQLITSRKCSFRLTISVCVCVCVFRLLILVSRKSLHTKSLSYHRNRSQYSCHFVIHRSLIPMNILCPKRIQSGLFK